MTNLDELKKQIEKISCENIKTNECINGGYYEFPHTRNYDSDLGFLIKLYEQLYELYQQLVNIYEIIEQNIQTILNNYLETEKLKVNLVYNESDTSLSFVWEVQQ